MFLRWPVVWCVYFGNQKGLPFFSGRLVTLDRPRGKDGEDEGKQNLMRSGQPTLIDRGHGKSQAPPGCQAKRPSPIR